MTKYGRSGLALLLLIGCALPWGAQAADGCSGAITVREANLAAIAGFIAERRAEVLTFEGYSGSGYQDPAAMLSHAARIIEQTDPATTLINIGATAVGIGAVYELAKRRGFTTMGVVSTLARDHAAALSPCVDHVFFVRDSSWGGRLPGSDELSPTSQAIVAISTALVAIGGGDVARDELLAARRAGKPVLFIPADMNHAIARDKARRKNLPPPSDFRGAAHAALLQEP